MAWDSSQHDGFMILKVVTLQMREASLLMNKAEAASLILCSLGNHTVSFLPYTTTKKSHASHLTKFKGKRHRLLPLHRDSVLSNTFQQCLKNTATNFNNALTI